MCRLRLVLRVSSHKMGRKILCHLGPVNEEMSEDKANTEVSNKLSSSILHYQTIIKAAI